jgi:peptidoglycan hydrolase-like protein with peptidoglycan-binding domain
MQMGEPTIERGSEGELVRQLQAGLIELRFRPGEVDGVYGVYTESAVKSLQIWALVESDGIVGPETWRKFDNGDKNHPELRKGAHQLAVRCVQRRLLGADIYEGEIDSKFGEKTDAAVRALQEREGLEVDGVVGPLTWDAVEFIEDFMPEMR